MTLLRALNEQTSSLAASDSGLHRFAIIDPAPSDARPSDYLPSVGKPVRLMPTPHSDPDSLPWLLPMTPDHDGWLSERRCSTGWGIVVESRLNTPELYPLLASKLIALDPDKVESLFRYYDPRVLRPMLERFTAPELEHFFAGLSRVGFVDGERTEWVLAPSDAILSPNSLQPIQLRREHLDVFPETDDTALIDEILAFIDYERPGAFESMDQRTVIQMVTTAIAKARRYDMIVAADIAAFGVIMFDVAPNFDEQPQIQACLANRLMPGRLRLRAAVTICSDAAWQEAEDNADPGA